MSVSTDSKKERQVLVLEPQQLFWATRCLSVLIQFFACSCLLPECPEDLRQSSDEALLSHTRLHCGNLRCHSSWGAQKLLREEVRRGCAEKA